MTAAAAAESLKKRKIAVLGSRSVGEYHISRLGGGILMRDCDGARCGELKHFCLFCLRKIVAREAIYRGEYICS